MSATPPKKGEVEHGASPADSDPPMDREVHDTQGQGGYSEFEVKEQDRWLPIANGWFPPSPSRRGRPLVLVRVAAFSCMFDCCRDWATGRRNTIDSHPLKFSRASASFSSEPKNDANIGNFAPVARIMKSALPDNAKIAKEAKECMQECVSEFISFITSEASEKCQQEKRKTVNGEDILFAMTSLGFENYAEALKIYLSRYRETLLANQNRPAGGLNAGGGSSTSGANASSAAAYDQPEGAANHNLLTGEMNAPEQNDTAFGFPVGRFNGNGPAE
ncbi:hypothetical protein K402DRAFT_326179 [Aulographum hederae CBS 113979]|uniref:Transcription factor CBF/NF-Y/archaeal histone domain-containing protein n=1 Tax=Aulographum hederae CBS 113979 TaxID=1176131 RepID=A0A6G1H916_9PEZI|nr:hypothetical protein K402DRAFT_326179 [Aulographum hederae CBS 113979]